MVRHESSRIGQTASGLGGDPSPGTGVTPLQTVGSRPEGARLAGSGAGTAEPGLALEEFVEAMVPSWPAIAVSHGDERLWVRCTGLPAETAEQIIHELFAAGRIPPRAPRPAEIELLTVYDRVWYGTHTRADGQAYHIIVKNDSCMILGPTARPADRRARGGKSDRRPGGRAASSPAGQAARRRDTV